MLVSAVPRSCFEMTGYLICIIIHSVVIVTGLLCLQSRRDAKSTVAAAA